MRLTFLGTADGHTRPGRQHSGLLIEAEGTRLLVDAGAAVESSLVSQGLDPNDLDAFYLSHMHSDHTAHVAGLIQHLWLTGRRKKLIFLGPTGVLAAMETWLSQSILFPGLIGFEIDWRELHPDKATRVGKVRLRPFATTHLAALQKHFGKKHLKTCFDCYGLALSAEGKRVVVSTDLGCADDLAKPLRQKTDLLITELAHFSPDALVEFLGKRQIDQVWLTHYPDRVVSEVASMRRAAKKNGFAGKIMAAKDGQQVRV